MRVIWAIAFTVVFGFLSFVAYLFSLFLSTQNGYIYVGIIAVATIVTGNLLILGVFNKSPKRLAIVIPTSLFVLPLVGYGGYEYYINTIEIKNAEVELTTYEPFHQSTKVAKLDKPSTFQI